MSNLTNTTSHFSVTEKVQYALKTALFRTMQTAFGDSGSKEIAAPARIFPKDIMQTDLVEIGKGDIDENGYFASVGLGSDYAWNTESNKANLEAAELIVAKYRIIDPSTNIITSIRVENLAGDHSGKTQAQINALPTTGQTYPLKNWFFRGHYTASLSDSAKFTNANTKYEGLQLAWDKAAPNTTATEADIVPHLKYYLQVQTDHTGESDGNSLDNHTYKHYKMKGLIGLESNFTSTIVVNRGEGGSCSNLNTTGTAAGEYWFTQATSGTLAFYGVGTSGQGGSTGDSLVNGNNGLTNLSTTKFPMISYVRYTGETGFGASSGGGGGGGSGSLYDFSSHTFTRCGAAGRYGPSLSDCTTEYSSTTWASNTAYFNQTITGIQDWTVPQTGTYTITAVGAAGGDGGYSTNTAGGSGGAGAKITRDFDLTGGEVIRILVGQQGFGDTTYSHCPGGGGGGTFITRAPHNTLESIIIIAGGGGGGGQTYWGQLHDGQKEASDKVGGADNGITGSSNGYSDGAGGKGPSNNTHGGNGGGFWGDGHSAYSGEGSTSGHSYVNASEPGHGGIGSTHSTKSEGGFGGGGAGNLLQGAGGGFAGGKYEGYWSNSGKAWGGSSYVQGEGPLYKHGNPSIVDDRPHTYQHPYGGPTTYRHGYVTIVKKLSLGIMNGETDPAYLLDVEGDVGLGMLVDPRDHFDFGFGYNAGTATDNGDGTRTMTRGGGDSVYDITNATPVGGWVAGVRYKITIEAKISSGTGNLEWRSGWTTYWTGGLTDEFQTWVFYRVGNWGPNYFKSYISDVTFKQFKIETRFLNIVDGNIGIGTMTPQTKLHISGISINPSTSTMSSATSQGILRLLGTGGIYMDFGFMISSPYTGWIQTHNGTTNGTGDDLALQPLSGNVGIGLTNPSYKLDVAGTFRATGYIYHSNYQYYYADTNTFRYWDSNNIYWGCNGSANVEMALYQGKLGIGTTSPQTRLDVTPRLSSNSCFATIRSYGNGNTTGGEKSGLYFGCHINNNMNSYGGRKMAIICDPLNGSGWGTVGVANMHFCISNSSGITQSADDCSISDSRLMIKSDGNVGIGTTSPQAMLQLEPTTGYTNPRTTTNYGSAIHIIPKNNADHTAITFSFSATDKNIMGAICANTSYGLEHIVNRSRHHYFYGSSSEVALPATTTNDLIMIMRGDNKRVGIGTTDPGGKLHTVGSSNVHALKVTGNCNDVAQIYGTGSNYGIRVTTAASSGSYYSAYFEGSSGKGLYVRDDGNVGIGETSPGAPLHIKFSQSGEPTNNIKDMIKLETEYSTDFGGSYREGGSSILFYVENSGQGLPGEAARIVAGCYESSATSEYHSYLAFHTSNNSGSTGTNERMVIDDNGYVGIGETVPLYTLDLNGNQRTRGYSLVANSDSSYHRYGPNSSWGNYLYVGSGPHFNAAEACIFNTTTNLHIEPGNGGVLYLGHYNDDETRIGSTYYSSFYGDGSRVCLQGAVDGGSSRGLFYWHTNDPSWGSYMVNDGQSLDGSGKSTSTPGNFTGWRIAMRCGDDSNGCFLWENHNEDQLASIRASDGWLQTKHAIWCHSGQCRFYEGVYVPNNTIVAGDAYGRGVIRCRAYNGVNREGNPGAGNWLLQRGEQGQLPGYGNSWYMVHKTDNSTMYFSANGQYSGYIGSGGAYHMNSYWTEHFTGQHRPLPYDEEMLKNLDDYIGLIVSATNEICSLIQDPKDGVYKMTSGIKGIHVNEAIPKVILTTQHKDKKCYGIVSGGEDENNFNSDTRATTNKNEKHYGHGSFTSVMICEEEDNRLYVNSVGEGGIWVSDEFGPIESGDYITTSGVLHGYGVLQDDDILHNYTVAKATIDCDFTISYKGMKKKTRVKRGCFKERDASDPANMIGKKEETIDEEFINCKPSNEYKCYHMARAICHEEEGCNGEKLAEDQTADNLKSKAAFKCKCSHKSDYNEHSGWCLNEDGLICDISYCVTGLNDCGECMVDKICECDISGECQKLVDDVELPHICCGVPVYKKGYKCEDISGDLYMWFDNEAAIDSSGELIYEECCNCCGKYGWRCTCDDGYGCDKEDMTEYSCCVKNCCYEPDYDVNASYKCREIIKDDKTYRIAFIACTYHCG